MLDYLSPGTASWNAHGFQFPSKGNYEASGPRTEGGKSLERQSERKNYIAMRNHIAQGHGVGGCVRGLSRLGTLSKSLGWGSGKVQPAGRHNSPGTDLHGQQSALFSISDDGTMERSSLVMRFIPFRLYG